MRVVLGFVSGLAIFLSGCYFNASRTILTNSDSGHSTPLNKSNLGEFVSGSGQYQITPVRKYKIRASAGGSNSALTLRTASGYTLYSSIEGSMIYDEQHGVH